MSQAVLPMPAPPDRPALPMVTLTALGLVYGDVGTSRLETGC
jgi:K+ transporter